MTIPTKRLAFVLAAAFALVPTACGGGASQQHGTLSRMSAAEGDQVELCEHEVPAEVCTRCHPELEDSFRAVGDWCGPHDVPESQCHLCHPDLTFTPLPELEAGADVRQLTDAEALAGITQHLADGRVTIVDFHAPWCAACHNLEAYLFQRLNQEPRLALRQVNVATWDGEIATRYLGGVEMLPYVEVYASDGTLVGSLSDFEPEALEALLAQALGSE